MGSAESAYRYEIETRVPPPPLLLLLLLLPPLNMLIFAFQDEAFALWKTHWGNIYPAKSPSREVIETISTSYYLVNLVDNDYVKGNCLFEVVYDVLEQLGKPRGPSIANPPA